MGSCAKDRCSGHADAQVYETVEDAAEDKLKLESSGYCHACALQAAMTGAPPAAITWDADVDVSL